LLVRSSQPDEQQVSPGAHGLFPDPAQTQTPAAQTSPAAQTWPQAPQLAGSVCRSWQPLAQQVSAGPHGSRLFGAQKH
jgi:hypothetical protein